MFWGKFLRFVPAYICVTLLFFVVSAANAAEVDRLKLQSELMAAAPSVEPHLIPNAAALLWTDAHYPERQLWSQYSESVINTVLDQLDEAQDIKSFCPNYDKIERDQKILVWAQLMAAISYWESRYNPVARGLETYADKGTDDVTGLPVYSDGLLQLSYQDVTQDEAGQYCHFDWESDKKLAPDDIHRTIYNPYNNLFCGIHMMAAYVQMNKSIVVKENYYWSTLQAGNLIEDKAGQMKSEVQQLPFCGKSRKRGIPVLGDVWDLLQRIGGSL